MKQASLVALVVLVCAAAASALLFFRTGASSAIEGRTSTAPVPSGPERHVAAAPAPERAETDERTSAIEDPPRDREPDAAATSTTTPDSLATIAGRVEDAAGLPALDARVEIASLVYKRVAIGQGFHEPRSTSVDGSGRFAFEALAPGDIPLRASTARGIAEAIITVRGGEQLDDVLLVLQPAGAVAGVVLDAQSDPLAGRIVHLMRGIDELQDRVSAEDGSFHFAGVPAGEYSVVTSSEDDHADEAAMLESMWSAVAQVEEGRTSKVILRPPGRAAVDVSGIVTRAGQPVAGVELLFLRDGSAVLGTARAAASDERGAYSARLDGPGCFVLLVAIESRQRSPRLALLVEAPPQPELAFDVALPAGGIEGHVLGPAGEPVPARVYVARDDRLFEFELFADHRATDTDEDGHYEIGDVLPGSYTLRIQPNAGELADCVVENVRVDVGPARADVRLSLGGAIRGRVIDAEGRAVEDAVIHARDARGRVLRSIGSARTDAAGGFVCHDLPLGLVTLSARTETAVSAESSVAVLEQESAPELVLSLSPGARLTVSVSDRDGRPVSAGIRVLDEHERDVGLLLSPEAEKLAIVRGISTSKADLGPLRPGSYRAIAETADGRRIEREVQIEGEPEVSIELRFGE